jgi:hypothetical protein
MSAPAPPDLDAYVENILQVAARDPSIAAVLREICGFESTVRAALDLVRAHLRGRGGTDDALACVETLAREEVARRIAERLGPAA